MSDPKHLLQRTIDSNTKKPIGIIHAYNKYLAQRSDMEPYEGVVPISGRIELGDTVTITRPAPVKVEGAPAADEKKEEEKPAGQDEPGLDSEPGDEGLVEMPHDDKIAKLVEVIKNLPKGEENFTGTGLPRIDALVMGLDVDGIEVSAKERDEALAIIEKAGK